MVISKSKGDKMTDPQQILRSMYEQAEEIQNFFRHKKGDTFLAENTLWHIGDACTYFKQNPESKILEPMFNGEPVPVIVPEDEFLKLHGGWGSKEKLIWIPSQSQLQSLIPNIKKYTFQFFYEDDLLMTRIDWDEWGMELLNALTFDILWLKIVMRLVYNKTWEEGSLSWETVTSKI